MKIESRRSIFSYPYFTVYCSTLRRARLSARKGNGAIPRAECRRAGVTRVLFLSAFSAALVKRSVRRANIKNMKIGPFIPIVPANTGWAITTEFKFSRHRRITRGSHTDDGLRAVLRGENLRSNILRSNEGKEVGLNSERTFTISNP